jgi:hypothetical protein
MPWLTVAQLQVVLELCTAVCYKHVSCWSLVELSGVEAATLRPLLDLL